MKRIHLFEFLDQPWYPKAWRRMQTDYLQFVANQGTGYVFLVPLIEKGLQQAQTNRIVDLCSGGTGPWLKLHQLLVEAGCPVDVKLTDKYPDPTSMQRWTTPSGVPIEYLTESVDAMQVPAHLDGMRTLFEGFHHFKPEQAQAILKDAAEQRVPIGIFEMSLNPPFGPLLLPLTPLMTILAYFLITPMIRPRTLTRFLWTYLLPIVPLVTCWDGIVSLLRVYTPSHLAELTEQIQTDQYQWEIGQASSGSPLFVFNYLIGYPTG